MDRAAVTREPQAREEKLRGHNILELQTKVTGVPGAFFRGGQQFFSAKTQSFLPKKYPLRGVKFSNSVLPS